VSEHLRTEELIGGILENYAARAVFRGFSRGPERKGRATYRLLWHRDQFFELILDVPRKTIKFPVVLPQVPADSAMYREFREFVDSRFSEDVPEHRRVDRSKVRAQVGNRTGNISLTLTVLDEDFDYAVRKLIHLVHEVYLDFLMDGRYYDYMIETFNLDPDKM